MGRAIGYQLLTGNIMKTVQVIIILLLFAAASAAYVWLRPAPETSAGPESVGMPDRQQADVRAAEPSTNSVPVEASEAVQPLGERGDAMLFEADALQHTPFDESIVQPFD